MSFTLSNALLEGLTKAGGRGVSEPAATDSENRSKPLAAKAESRGVLVAGPGAGGASDQGTSSSSDSGGVEKVGTGLPEQLASSESQDDPCRPKGS
jgi:hypothetical protein